MGVVDETVRVIFKGDATDLSNAFRSIDKKISGIGDALGSAMRGDIEGFGRSMYRVLGATGLAIGAVGGLTIGAGALAKNYYQSGLEVKKFADALGITMPEASALTDITGDLGIETGAMEMAAKKLAAEGLPLTMQALAGLAAEYQALEEPQARVAFLTEHFGRSGQDLATMLEMNTTALANWQTQLGEGQLWTEEEGAQLTAMRDKWNEVDDAVTNLKLEVGGMIAIPLADFITNVANGLASWKGNMEMLYIIVGTLNDYINTKFAAALVKVQSGFDKIARAVQGWIDKINALKAAMPKWLIPGSPTPFELGLRGISNAMRDVGPMGVPAGGNTGAVAGADTAEMKGIRDDISWMVRQLPLTIRDAVVMGK